MTGWRDGFIRCHDRTTQTIIWEIANAHRGSITSVYADANYILSGGQDGAVRVWARVNKKLLIQFNGKSKIYFLSNIYLYTDQKKDIVSLFPDLDRPHIIHSCSMDRSVSTYDLKLEKRINGHSTTNGALYGMT